MVKAGGIVASSSSSSTSTSTSPTTSPLDLNLIQSESESESSSSNLNGSSSTQSKSKSPNPSSIKPLSNNNALTSSSTKSNGVSTRTKINSSKSESLPPNAISKSINVSKPFTQSLSKDSKDSNLPEMLSNSNNNNNTITLKTLGVTLKMDSTNKNKSKSSKFDTTKNGDAPVENDLTSLFNNVNDFPISTVEGSSSSSMSSLMMINTITGNGLLNANTTIEAEANNNENVLEYSRMLFGHSDIIDINFDNLLTNPNDPIDLGNDVNNMDLDDLIGTYDSLESSSKLSGNNNNMMDLDLDSIMADLDRNFMESENLNGMSGNSLNMDLSSILVNMNDSLVDTIYSNGIHNEVGIEVQSNGVHNDEVLNGVQVQNNGVHNDEVQNNGVNDGEHGEHLGIYAEMTNGNINVDFTLGNINGHNGYSHENIEETINGVEDMVEDEGKDVAGKKINGDTVTLNEGKKGGEKKNSETE